MKRILTASAISAFAIAAAPVHASAIWYDYIPGGMYAQSLSNGFSEFNEFWTFDDRGYMDAIYLTLHPYAYAVPASPPGYAPFYLFGLNLPVELDFPPDTHLQVSGNVPVDVYVHDGAISALFLPVNNADLEDYWLKNPTVSFEIYGGVPEPQTWALMIAGVGLMGARLRTKRRLTSCGN